MPKSREFSWAAGAGEEGNEALARTAIEMFILEYANPIARGAKRKSDAMHLHCAGQQRWATFQFAFRFLFFFFRWVLGPGMCPKDLSSNKGFECLENNSILNRIIIFFKEIFTLISLGFCWVKVLGD